MIRIGAVSYLNTRPLIHGLQQRLDGWGTLSLNLPSRLADDLAAERLDVALIPSVEYFRGRCRGYEIISDAVIACRGPVWSVRLLSRVPLHRIKSLALDVGSRTSAALVQVLLRRAFGLSPRTVPLELEQLPESTDTDAVLVIGDRAMHPPAGVYHEIIDLGQWWHRLTELPFVFAMWVARGGLDSETKAAIDRALRQSRDAGLESIDAVAAAEAGTHGLTVAELVRYFSEHLHFFLGPDEKAGLNTFYNDLRTLGILTPAEIDLPADLPL